MRLLILLLFVSSLSYGQTKYYIRADSTVLEKIGGNNELNLLNSTRARTGAYLKNVSNGRTGFFYAVDSAYISGSNLVLVRGGGSQNVTVAVPASAAAWNLTGNATTTPGTNFLGTTDSINLMLKVNNQQAALFDMGNLNVSLGIRALRSNTSGSINTVFGYEAMMVNTTGADNAAFGFRALSKSTTSSSTLNTAIGNFALRDNTTGSSNTAVGASALRSNIIGVENTAVGVDALVSNTASSNTAVGVEALKTNTSGSLNTAVGKYSQREGATGTLNTSVGYQSLKVATGIANVAIGNNALLVNTTGFKNTAVGAGSMEKTTTGFENTFVGEDAGLNNTTGAVNNGVGWLAGSGNVAGNQNNYFGVSAGRSQTSGDNNIFIGHEAGFSGSQLAGINNSIAIGQGVFTEADNQIRIGNASHTQTWLRGMLYFDGATGTAAQSIRVNAGATGMEWYTPTAGVNIYNSDGTLTGNRTVTGGGFDFTWNNAGTVLLNSTTDMALTNTTTGASQLSLGDNNAQMNVSLAGKSSDIYVSPDSVKINPSLGNLRIDTLNYTLSTTRKKIMLRDTVTGLVENIDPALIGGGSGLTVGTTTITSGTNGGIGYNNSGIYNESSDFLYEDVGKALWVGQATGGGEVRSYQSGGGEYMSLKTDVGTNKSGLFRSNTDFIAYYSTATGATHIDATFANQPINLDIMGTTKMNLNSSGKLFIGGTTSATTGLHVSTRFASTQGADVASVAGAIALGTDGNSFEITGTNAITLISNVGWVNGAEVTLLFTSTATLTDGTANSGTDIGMELAANTNFVASAGATLTLVLSEIGGTQRWREKCRSVN